MEYGVLYEKGCRERNQDSLALHRMMTQRGEVVLAAVCDGLGGMDAGEIASGYVAERLSIWFYEDLPDLLEKRRSKKAL
ncbi:MAG: serine/threonine-protein phosphatase, partial [Lachnospiraceae bacterium]|nr:serine/threonine-protein phosphatase [Lachnospiraceae bacterium]